MRFSKFHNMIWAALVGLGLAQGAWAGAQSSAMIDSVQFSLTDLAPADGIVPSYSVASTGNTDGAASMTSASVENWGASGTPVTQYGSAWAMFAPGSSSASLPQGTQGSAVMDGTTLYAAGTAQGVDGSETRYATVANTFAGAQATWYSDDIVGALTLSPKSSLTVTVHGFLLADASNPSGELCKYMNGCVSEEATAAISLTSTYRPAPYTQALQDYQAPLITASAGEYWGSTFDPVTQEWTATHYTTSTGPLSQEVNISTTIVNDTDLPRTAFIGIAAVTFGRGVTPLAAIPEPSSFWLMSLGLVAGLASVRAKRAQGQVK